MSQSADTASVAHPSPARNGEGDLNGDRALAWFDELVWHNSYVCSHCFARLKDGLNGPIINSGGKRLDVTVNWRTPGATLEYGHDPLPDPPKTTCENCASVGGGAFYDTLSESEMVDRVPELIDRIHEAGYQVNVGTIYDVVRQLATDEDHEANDKEIFATAAALGVDKA